MFLRASGLIYERLYLITLGATCRYAITAEDGSLTLTDPGASAHITSLEERLTRFKMPVSSLKNILLTHLDTDRIAGIPLLRRKAPKLRVFGTAQMHAALKDENFVRRIWEQDKEISSWVPRTQASPLSYDEFAQGLKLDKHLVESDSVAIDEDVTIRSLSTPGHRSHSISYLVVPHEFAIVDETFGYYHGRELAAPGGDADLRQAVESSKKFADVSLSGIGFSYGGVITGGLVKKHLAALAQNTSDLISEVERARRDGFSEADILQQVQNGLYTSTVNDPCLKRSLQGTFQAVMKQLSRT